VTTEHPWTFSGIYLADSASFLAPIVVLALPLRHVGNAVRLTTQRAGQPDVPGAAPATSAISAISAISGQDARGGYLAVLHDSVFREVLVITFFSAFVGYAQMEAGWTAYARVIADASTRVIGFAFAANTGVIVLLQLFVLQRIEGRRRTRALMLMSAIWAAAWTLMGASGLVPGTLVASVLLVVSLGVFGLGETLLSPVGAAVINDLAPDHLRGRYNATNSAVFQVAAIVGPIAAGHLLGWRMPAVFVGMLLLGCVVMVVLLHRIEPVIPAHANGVPERPAART
jgi:MFS family permease